MPGGGGGIVEVGVHLPGGVFRPRMSRHWNLMAFGIHALNIGRIIRVPAASTGTAGGACTDYAAGHKPLPAPMAAPLPPPNAAPAATPNAVPTVALVTPLFTAA